MKKKQLFCFNGQQKMVADITNQLGYNLEQSKLSTRRWRNLCELTISKGKCFIVIDCSLFVFNGNLGLC